MATAMVRLHTAVDNDFLITRHLNGCIIVSIDSHPIVPAWLTHDILIMVSRWPQKSSWGLSHLPQPMIELPGCKHNGLTGLRGSSPCPSTFPASVSLPCTPFTTHHKDAARGPLPLTTQQSLPIVPKPWLAGKALSSHRWVLLVPAVWRCKVWPLHCHLAQLCLCTQCFSMKHQAQ